MQVVGSFYNHRLLHGTKNENKNNKRNDCIAVSFLIYVSLLLCLCILIVYLCIFIVMYVLHSVSLCCFVYCLCVNVYLQLPPGVNPIAANKIYQYQYIKNLRSPIKIFITRITAKLTMKLL